MRALALECVPSPSVVRALLRDKSDDDVLASPSAADDALASSYVSSLDAKLSALRDELRRAARPNPTTKRIESRAKPRIEIIGDKTIAVDTVDADDVVLAWACASLVVATHAKTSTGDVPKWSSASASTVATSMHDECFRNDLKTTLMAFAGASDEIFRALEAPRNSFQASSADTELAAHVAARQLFWYLDYDALQGEKECTEAMARMIPCVLRAMDYPSGVVKMYGAVCAERALKWTMYDWRQGCGSVLLDTLRSALVGATADVWSHALNASCALTVIMANGEDVAKEYRETFTRILDHASLRAADVQYAEPLVASLPLLIANAKICVASHLKRLLPLLCGYLQSYKDSVSIGAAKIIALVIENAWPRIGAHCAAMWPELKRAYAEADGRSAITSDALRRELEHIAELLHLAAGDAFSSTWTADADIPAHAESFVEFLRALPARMVSSGK